MAHFTRFQANICLLCICTHIPLYGNIYPTANERTAGAAKGEDMGAKYTEAQAKASREYLKNLDEIRIRIPKGKKEEYKQAAEAAGKSLNQFIVDCIEKR